MLLPVLLALGLAADPAPVARVHAGSARAALAGEVVALGPRSGARALPEPVWLECGPRSAVELAWRGRASVRLDGAAGLTVGPGGVLTVDAYEALELEVRRDALSLELPGLERIDLGACVVRVRALPDGVHEVTNRGGSPLRVAGVELAPGGRVRLRASR